jgi:arylsulfatase A-like enzyme
VPDARPNILYVFTDQQSAAAMSCAGNTDLHTPNMDALAARGVRFDRAYCAYPLCTPSRAAMFSGFWPHQVGIRVNGQGFCEEALGRTLGHVMTAGGYDCVYAGKWHVPEGSIPDGVHGFRSLCGWGDERVPGACAEYFRQAGDRPFFMVASFVDPHAICEYGRFDVAPFGDVGEPAPGQCPNLPANFAPAPHEAQVFREWHDSQMFLQIPAGNSPEQWRRYRWGYYRFIERVDRRLGEILDALRAAGLEDNTLIVFSSDHGDSAGAHRFAQKWNFYDESARVPFLVAAPGIEGGRRSRYLVNNGVDLAPTVCEAAGIEPSRDWPGVSLLPALDPDAEPPAREAVVAETRLTDSGVDGRMVRTDRYKYTIWKWGANREQLIDMDADPGEMVNLAIEDRDAGELQRHRDLLASWCRETHDDFGRHHGFGNVPYCVPGIERKQLP